jgi:hypothetical protein
MRPSCGVSVAIAAACMWAYAVECKPVERVQLLVGVFITPQTPFELRQAFRNATRGVLPRVRLVFFVGIEGNFSEEQRAHRDIVQGSRSFLKRYSKATQTAPPRTSFSPSAAFPKLLQSYSNAIPLAPL